MKHEQLLIITRQGWFRLHGDLLGEIPAWQRVQGAALVIVDFEDAAVGIHVCRGRPEYAAAQVEKHARTEGLSEGPTHVMLHARQQADDGSQVFYTAVPLAAWQQLQIWAAQQNDHCLVVPLGSLLAQWLKNGQMRLLRMGRDLHLLALQDGRLAYFSASGIGSSQEDLQAALRGLVQQARIVRGSATGGRLSWGCVFGNRLEEEQALLDQMAKSAQIPGELLAHDVVRTQGGEARISALPMLCSRISWRDLQAPLLARAAWWSERLVAPLAAATAVVGLGLGVAGLLLQNQVSSERAANQPLQQQAKALEERIVAANAISTSVLQDDAVKLVQQLGNAVRYDPVTMLQRLREAAGSDIRILRLSLSDSHGSSGTVPAFIVDGVAMADTSAVLARFLSSLRAHGWHAESTAPKDNATGAFAYRLTAMTVPTSDDKGRQP